MKEKVAYEKGYRVSISGDYVTYKGKNRKLRVKKVYPLFGIRLYDNRKIDINVHRLQAYQKFGDNIFKKGTEVRHLDGNPLNNSWSNIEIGSPSENSMDKSKEIRLKVSIIATRKFQDSIRSYEERCKIYNDLHIGKSYSEIMKEHNIKSKGTLSFMKNKSLEYKEYLNREVF